MKLNVKKTHTLQRERRSKRPLWCGFPVYYVELDDSCMNHYFQVFDSQCLASGFYTVCFVLPCREWPSPWRSACSWASTACCRPASFRRTFRCCASWRATKRASTRWTSERTRTTSGFCSFHKVVLLWQQWGCVFLRANGLISSSPNGSSSLCSQVHPADDSAGPQREALLPPADLWHWEVHAHCVHAHCRPGLSAVWAGFQEATVGEDYDIIHTALTAIWFIFFYCVNSW